MGDKITVAGIEIEVVSEEEAEKATFVVCGDADQGPYPWDDNVETTCALCGKDVVHRPSAPKAPMKICIQCMMDSTGPGNS